ncbi:MAG: thioredoxin [Deltaproteobacteria bacterium]|nr:MAG: thioredoxin [Deltaproteobacteria bacterium]
MNFLMVAAVAVGGFIALLFAFQLFMVFKMRRKEGKPAPSLDGKPGKLIEKGNRAVFYFYSPSCGACKAMTPVFRKMARTKKNVFPVDISTDMATARKFGVMATPTVIVVNNKTIEKVLIGPQPQATLQSLA